MKYTEIEHEHPYDTYILLRELLFPAIYIYIYMYMCVHFSMFYCISNDLYLSTG